MNTILFALVLAVVVPLALGTSVTDADWFGYKTAYGKTYATSGLESTARFYYAVNKDKIATHNKRYTSGTESYRLDVNQYSDLRFIEFAALFPATTEIASNAAPFTVPSATPQTSFDYAAQGFNSPVQDQGQVCNSGWAYAAATALQIYSASTTGNPSSSLLSAQNLIDCVGGSKSCTNQVSQVAFDYLTQHSQKIYPASAYPNKPTQGQGMCLFPSTQTGAVTLTSYSTIANGNDVALKSVVNYVAPVVIKFNPGSFEFMHYKEGVFTQPPPTQTAAQYLTVVGYGSDATRSKDYWLVQNSLGTTWGENGFIRIERNTQKPITNSAIFPSL